MSFMKEIELLRIPFKDIEEATKNFTTQIGRGGYGLVYRGELSVSEKLTAVAVKRLQTDHRFGHGLKEFLTEIQLLSRYKHKNIVSFLGFCEEQNEKVLIYKYAERGSLDSYLKPSKNRPPLTWKQRISICVDGARGLDHLHNHVAQNERVIHRDIKSANILIDQNWKAMIADFGLSKLGRANENITYLISNPCGTLGYFDPTYFRTGVLTKKSDVYSFGVVLVEVLCGRLCFIKVNSTEPLLAPLAQSYYQDKKLNLIIDPGLKNYINSDSMKIFSEIAFQCLHDDREQRPSMGLVLEKLEKVLELLEKEETPELRELEDAPELKKLVETLQKQEPVYIGKECELEIKNTDRTCDKDLVNLHKTTMEHIIKTEPYQPKSNRPMEAVLLANKSVAEVKNKDRTCREWHANLYNPTMEHMIKTEPYQSEINSSDASCSFEIVPFTDYKSPFERAIGEQMECCEKQKKRSRALAAWKWDEVIDLEVSSGYEGDDEYDLSDTADSLASLMRRTKMPKVLVDTRNRGVHV